MVQIGSLDFVRWAGLRVPAEVSNAERKKKPHACDVDHGLGCITVSESRREVKRFGGRVNRRS
jgi:hypothetical protein